jgi:hypothetical protein
MMFKILHAIFVSFVSMQTCSAIDYEPLSLPELVVRADVIVLGTVFSVGESNVIHVDEVLLGATNKEIAFPKMEDVQLTKGEIPIFFFVKNKDSLNLIYPFAYAEPDRIDEIKRLIEMRIDPHKYFQDRKWNSTPDYLAIVGHVMAGKDRIGELTNAKFGDHLAAQLASDNDQAVLEALAGLRRLGRQVPAAKIVPLIRGHDESVRLAAVQYLEWTLDKDALDPLCHLLEGTLANDRVSWFICRVLGPMRDTTAAPYLERAVKRGVEAGTALGAVGDESCFEVLLERANTHNSLDALGGLSRLVYRSNLEHEAWMSVHRKRSTTGLDHKDKWTQWWNENKAEFKVTKTADEALGPIKK